MSRIIWKKLEYGDRLEEGDAYIAHTSGDLNHTNHPNHKERTAVFINGTYLGCDAMAFTGLAFWRPIGIDTGSPVIDPNNPERKIEMEL